MRNTAGRATPLLRIARKYVPALPGIVVLGLLASVLESAGIRLLIPLLSAMGSAPAPHALPEPLRSAGELVLHYDPSTRILLLAAIIAALIAAKGAVQAANGCFVAMIDNRIGRDIRNALAGRLLSLDYPFFLDHDPARLSRIMTTDSWFAGEAVHWALALIPAAIAILVFGALLAWLNPALFVIVFAGTIVIQATLYLLERRQRRLAARITQSDRKIWARMTTLVNASRVIRIFGQEERERALFAEATDEFRTTLSGSRYLAATVSPLIELLVAILFIVVVLAGFRIGLSLAEIATFLVLLSRLQSPAAVMRESRLGIAGVSGSLREVRWLLDQQPATVPMLAGSTAEAIELDQPISFERVSYAYPNGTAALRDASFTIRPGIATALIGHSGSGKTTIVNLLCRLVEPQSGSILLGKRVAAQSSPLAWRSRIAVAGQDAELVDATIAENIAYGCPGASRDEIEDAARTAGADSFIAGLPGGYDTRAGQGGVNLSGGQRQRIGIARALLRRPDLLILDEATSAVDAMSEMEIIRLLSDSRYFRTALVISHRKSTLSACADGIVIADGQIAECGPLPKLAYFRSMSAVTDAAA